VEQSYPLDEVPRAVRHLLDGHTRGKIVVAVHHADEV
jgi:NADPH:quinone reductase-like Zn-dependent oxidoreductase